MFERTTEKGSVWVTLKHCEWSSFICIFFSIFTSYTFIDKFSNYCSCWKLIVVCFFLWLSPASDKSKVKRNKMKTAGEKIEFKCLIRATDGKKTISTMVCTILASLSFPILSSFYFQLILYENINKLQILENSVCSNSQSYLHQGCWTRKWVMFRNGLIVLSYSISDVVVPGVPIPFLYF